MLLLGPGVGAGAVVVPTGFVDDVLLTGLDEPTSLAFLPDGRTLFTEQRTGKVRMLVNGHIASTDPIFVVPDLVAADEERGLLGIAVDPAWPARPFVYLYYTRQGGAIRIVRYLANEDVDVPNGENITFSSQRLLIDDIPDVNPIHNAGCLRFGPDGCLYASLGDDNFPCLAADSSSLHGAILRLDVAGLPIFGGRQVRRAAITPFNNPFVTSPDSNARLVYAFGLRNPWRFHIDNVTGLVYSCDVGENTVEEIDEVSPGDFLGWPWREGDYIRDRPACPEPGGGGTMLYRHPIASFVHDQPIAYAVIAAGVYRPVLGGANNWPLSYYHIRGDVFYGQYYEGYLRRLVYDGSGWAPADSVPGQPNATDWATGLTTDVDFQVGPDGSLWWLAQFDSIYAPVTGSLHRIRFLGQPTAAPVVAPFVSALRANPNPFAGSTELDFEMPAAGGMRLAIFDPSGRRVRTLLRAWMPTGVARARWDGRDDDGRAAAAGVYFARLEREGAPPLVARLLRLR
jgi:hypothetical protein